MITTHRLFLRFVVGIASNFYSLLLSFSTLHWTPSISRSVYRSETKAKSTTFIHFCMTEDGHFSLKINKSKRRQKKFRELIFLAVHLLSREILLRKKKKNGDWLNRLIYSMLCALWTKSTQFIGSFYILKFSLFVFFSFHVTIEFIFNIYY